jgi:hypothetical protein
MSLWHKSVSDLAFADIDAFCRTKQREGIRLDYKVDQPTDLAKLIAAFANTLGGLIVLGVEADKTTNQPVWPPQKGMPNKPGIDEAVTAIARDAIYPPVRVNISPIIENSLLPGHSLAIVRVDESKDAPHAVERRKIYERTGSGNKPYDLAHIDRIESLINRRRRIEEEREIIRSRAIARGQRLVSESLKPTIWVSVIPLYPWRDICKPSACYNHFELTYPTKGVRRIPDGGMFVSEVVLRELGPVVPAVISCDSRGHFLYVRGLVAVVPVIPPHHELHRVREYPDREFDILSVKQRIEDMVKEARAFYQKPGIERPGLLSVVLGMSGTRNIRFYSQNDSDDSKRFLDDDYHHEILLNFDDFLSRSDSVSPLIDRIRFAFDVSSPEGQ